MSKETVEVVAGPGAGKSTWLWQMIYANPDQPVWIFDNERKMRAVNKMFGGKDPDNVTLLNTVTIPETIEAYQDVVWPAVSKEPEGTGIIAIDMVDKWWERAQEHFPKAMAGGDDDFSYTELLTNVLKQRKADAEAKKRKVGQATLNPFEGFTDWPLIKKWHNGDLLEPILYNTPCHVIATAGSRELRDPEDPALRSSPVKDSLERTQLWRGFGNIPMGEKNNDYRFITLIGIKKLGFTLDTEWHMWLVKDQSRRLGQPDPRFSGHVLTPEVDPETEESTGVVNLWFDYCSLTGAPEQLEVGE